MNEIRISANGDAFTVNGQLWTAAPLVEQLCHALGSNELTDGDPVIVGGKTIAKFRYFDDLGVAVLQSILDAKLWRITIYMETSPRNRPSPYGNTGQRPPKKVFRGQLEINGKQLRSPLRFAQFPLKGEFEFINHKASGANVQAFVAEDSGITEYVSFEFNRE